jgi:hypothetical protein
MSETRRETVKANDAWLVWSFEHDAWWAANSCGYTTGLLNAGVYSEAEAKEIEAGSTYGKTRREEARSLASVLDAEAQKGWNSPKVLDLLQRALTPESADAV